MATPRTGRPGGRPPSRKAKENAARKPSSTSQANPKVPAPESLGDIGSKKWAWLWETCDWLEASDAMVLEELCLLYDELNYVESKLALVGEMFYRMPNGIFAEHPLSKERKNIKVEITSKQASIGLTPTDRARLQLTSDAASELKRLIDQRPGAGVIRSE